MMMSIATYNRNNERVNDTTFLNKEADTGKWELLSAILLITAGGFIYILYRSQHIILNEAIGVCFPWIQQCRNMSASWILNRRWLGEFIVYSLPGGLWASSYILFIDYFYKAKEPSLKFRLASTVPLIGAVSELLQACFPTGYMLSDIHIGNYDSLDLLSYLMPLAAYFLYLKLSKA